MNQFEHVIRLVFWICTAVILYAYVGYPLAIYCLSQIFGSKPMPHSTDSQELPSISLLIAAYNEEDVIENRIQNALAMDYPCDKIEIVIASDGSSDRTAEIVRRYANRGVRLLDYSDRRGKASVLNSAIAELKTELVILSDANTHTDTDAAKRLARWFIDPSVGVVCGRLVLTDAATGGNADGAYWKYETFLKKCEARLGALLGANGAIYAIRRALYRPIPAEMIVDDFVIPLAARLRTRCRIVYDADAIAHEETAKDIQGEFGRRVRIGAGGFQAIAMLWRLLDPRQGWVAFAFLSHKVLRWCCPLFMVGALVSNVLLWNHIVYRWICLGQIILYLGSLLCMRNPGLLRISRIARMGTMFVSMNAALLIGLWRWLSGTQKAAWQRTARQTESPRLA